MSTTNETSLLQRFMTRSIRTYGSRLWIERQISDIRRDIPDVYAHIDGIFLPMEAKFSFEGKESILSHKFKRGQIEKLRMFRSVGAYALGIVFRNEELRYVHPQDIRDDGQMSLSQFDSLPLFDWEEVIADGQNYSLSFRRRQVSPNK